MRWNSIAMLLKLRFRLPILFLQAHTITRFLESTIQRKLFTVRLFILEMTQHYSSARIVSL